MPALENRPVAAQTPKLAVASGNGANTSLDGTGTTYKLTVQGRATTAGPKGSAVNKLTIWPQGQVGATRIAIFADDGGGTKYLWAMGDLAAYTPSNTAAPEPLKLHDPDQPDVKPRALPASADLYLAIAVAPTSGTIVAMAELQDLEDRVDAV